MSKAPWWRRAVVADKPRAVHRERDVERLKADVVDDLVVGALEERRVDRAHRLGALEREAGGQEHRVLLGDADVVVLCSGISSASFCSPVPPAIAAVIADHLRIEFCLGDHRVGEDLRVLRWR